MKLVIHHLGVSQSERILWLCEELNVPYELVKHTRDPFGAPASLKSVPGNTSGKAPFVEDQDAGVTLSESGAICEYIMAKAHDGGQRLALPSSHPDYVEYLRWFHGANATLQADMVCSVFVDIAVAGMDAKTDNMAKKLADSRLDANLRVLDDRLRQNKWLAGEEFTAADVMSVYSLTTQRYFGPLVSLAPYPNVLRYLADCAARPAYQRAMEKGDPEMKLLVGAEPPEKGLLEVGGVASDSWKKK